MADLTELDRAECVKIAGANPSTGIADNFVSADSNGNLNVVTTASGSAVGGIAATNSDLAGGVYNSALPTLTTGQQSALQLDSSGRLIIAPLTNVSIVKAQLQDNAGDGITSTTISSKQRLDVALSSEAQDGAASPFNVLMVGGETPTATIEPIAVDASGNTMEVGNVASLASDSGNPVKIGGVYHTALPSPSDGQRVDAQSDYKGRLIPAPLSLSYFHPIYTTRIQTAANSNSSNALTLATTINATKSGSLIVVCASSVAGTLTCTDSASQTYSTAVTVNTGGGTPKFNYIFYKANSVSGVTSVTITDGSSTALNMIVSEYADITSTPLDKTQSNNGSVASTSFTSNATAATAQANELLIGCAFDIAHNNTTFSAGTSWTSVNSVLNGAGGGGSLFQEEQFVNSTGTYAATGTMSQSDAYLATIATFEISSYPTGFTIPNNATLIKSGQGTLSSVTVNTSGTASANITFYDNTTNSGTIIAVLSLTQNIGNVPYNIHFTNGLTMVVNSTTGDFTVTYD